MRIGIVGKRGLAGISGLRSVHGIEVAAYAEFSQIERERAQTELGIPFACEEYADFLDRVDAVVLGTPMPDHAAQALTALKAGKHVLCEVPAVVTLDECKALSDEIARSGLVFMMAENYCFFRENVIVREMAARGMFGAPYYAEGQYVHEVRFLHRDAQGNPTWRKKWQVGIRGNTYITHELGPPMQWFRACDPSIRIESVACFGTGSHTDPDLEHDDSCSTLIKLSNGGLINIRLDMISNRPGKSAYSFQGTSGVFENDPGRGIHLSDGRSHSFSDPHREWQSVEDFADLMSAELAQELREASTSGHGGSDYMTGRRFAQAIQGLREPAVSVFDSLEWTVAGLVSQESILRGSVPLPMPDWLANVSNHL